MSSAFSPGEDRWQERLGKLRDVVRRELLTRQLAAELPPPPASVLDIGCGQGTQALRLARRGYRVTGVDPSAKLLDRFRNDVAAEPAEVRERVRLLHGEAHDFTERRDVPPVEIVLCHGVLMYLADPGPLLSQIASLLVPGGTFSLLVRNGDALAMRPGLLGDWRTCRDAFGSDRYLNRIGVHARADRRADLTERLSGLGLGVTAWYGVRVFTDTAVDDAPVPADIEDLLDCEERAGRTDPYRGVAALLHLIARR